MYEKPRLEQYGTFRDLTRGYIGNATVTNAQGGHDGVGSASIAKAGIIVPLFLAQIGGGGGGLGASSQF